MIVNKQAVIAAAAKKRAFLKSVAQRNKMFFLEHRRNHQNASTSTSITYVVDYDHRKIKSCPITNGTKVTFESLKTDKCALKYINDMGSQNVVVMNFANRHHQGGGYLQGAGAQEEDLMRVMPIMYPSFSKVNYPFKPDTVLVTPNLTIMRDSDNDYKFMSRNEQRVVSVVSAAAQDLRIDSGEEFDEACVRRTLKNMYCAISDKIPNADTLILGAWGCGAFYNDPQIMASIMNEINYQYGGQFKHIVFSIPPGHNYDVFSSIIPTIA